MLFIYFLCSYIYSNSYNISSKQYLYLLCNLKSLKGKSLLNKKKFQKIIPTSFSTSNSKTLFLYYFFLNPFWKVHSAVLNRFSFKMKFSTIMKWNFLHYFRAISAVSSSISAITATVGWFFDKYFLYIIFLNFISFTF